MNPSDLGERCLEVARVDLVAEARDVEVVARVVATVAVSRGEGRGARRSAGAVIEGGGQGKEWEGRNRDDKVA